MKYVIMFCETAEDQESYQKHSEAERNVIYGQIGRWFEENGSKIVGGEELARPHTATTVRFDANRRPTVTDGPYLEAKEVIGGFAIVDVADLDEALRLAKTWPGGSTVEVRPVVEH